MQISEALVITAVFSCADDALAAAQTLRDAGVPERNMRVAAGCVVRVQVASHDVDRTAAQLRASGACDLSATTIADPSWMSHFAGRVTGSKVMPGQGDAEAGSPAGRLT
jgi:hypothetical protein